MTRHSFTLLLAIALFWSSAAGAQTKRRAYVLYSGMHVDLVAESIKSKVRFHLCCDVGPNVMLRVNDAVIDRILRETDAKHCPAWRKTHADAAHGSSLSQLISRSREAELQMSLDEDRH